MSIHYDLKRLTVKIFNRFIHKKTNLVAALLTVEQSSPQTSTDALLPVPPPHGLLRGGPGSRRQLRQILVIQVQTLGLVLIQRRDDPVIPEQREREEKHTQAPKLSNTHTGICNKCVRPPPHLSIPSPIRSSPSPSSSSSPGRCDSPSSPSDSSSKGGRSRPGLEVMSPLLEARLGLVAMWYDSEESCPTTQNNIDKLLQLLLFKYRNIFCNRPPSLSVLNEFIKLQSLALVFYTVRF